MCTRPFDRYGEVRKRTWHCTVDEYIFYSKRRSSASSSMYGGFDLHDLPRGPRSDTKTCGAKASRGKEPKHRKEPKRRKNDAVSQKRAAETNLYL